MDKCKRACFNCVFPLYRISSFDPPPARIFGWRVLELKEQGVGEEEAMAVADVWFLDSWILLSL